MRALDFCLAVVGVFFSLSGQLAIAATRYVDASVSESGDGESWETAFRKIQEGIDAASDGDTVIVVPATYVENTHFKGKNIVLTSLYPPDPDIVTSTIIDGNQAGSVVTFSGTEDETCVLSGFTIEHGESSNGGGICGGDHENRTRAAIRNNVITNNEGYEDYPGAGLVYCDGLIEKNVITGNSGSYAGGGLAYCNGTIAANTITENSAESGGGLYSCDGLIRSNVISENYGGGLTYCNGIIQNNIISNNSAGNGGGLHECNGTIVNNTVVGNSAEWGGGGLCGCEGLILNCIIYGNTANSGDQLWGSSEPTYSCIQRWAGGGEGNISCCPYFVDGANGDYHLKTYSPCIDAGDPSSDFSKEPQPNGGRINMGAYGNTPEATSASPDSDKDGLPDEWEMLVFGDLKRGTSEDSDGDLWTNFQEYCHATDPAESRKWYVDGSVARSGDGSSWATAFKLI